VDHPDQARRLLTTAARAKFRRAAVGFSLPEILVAVAIIGLLTVVMAPVVLNRLALARADSIVSEMQNLQQALQVFNRDVGRYPQRLDYLSVLPTPATNVLDACGTQISAQNQAKFRGPYVNREIVMIDPFNVVPANRVTKYVLATGDSVDAVLTRTTSGTQQVLQILVYGLDQSTTQRVDSTVDGVLDSSNGIVQYAAIQPTQNTIKWNIPIKNGAC
jgi:prepilin-type N-terminal cleavage/methylation domain-containing protein